VIGVGAIGRQVAIQLTAIGAAKIQLIDFDTVEQTNLSSQGYLLNDLYLPKIEATANFCKQMNSDTEFSIINDRFKRSFDTNTCVFMCVDRISARRHIWNSIKNRVRFLCDGRMAAETLRIITVTLFDKEYYEKTLFNQNEAYRGSCTAKSTIYCANIAAGLMVAQFTKWLRDAPMDKDFNMNLFSMEFGIT